MKPLLDAINDFQDDATELAEERSSLESKVSAAS